MYVPVLSSTGARKEGPEQNSKHAHAHATRHKHSAIYVRHAQQKQAKDAHARTDNSARKIYPSHQYFISYFISCQRAKKTKQTRSGRVQLNTRSACKQKHTRARLFHSPVQERLRAEVRDGDGVAESLGAPHRQNDLLPTVVDRQDVRGRHRPVPRLASGESDHVHLARGEPFFSFARGQC